MSNFPLTPPRGRFLDLHGCLLGTGPIDDLNKIMRGSGKAPAEINWVPFEPLPDSLFEEPPSAPSSSAPTHIPQLITTHGIDAGDCNVVLGSVYELPFPTAFKTLLGSAMALWAGSAPDPSTIKHHGLDQVINGFMDFVSPPLPTAVSPVRLPVEIPPTPQYSDPPLPSPLPRDEDAVMSDHMSSHIRTPTPRPLEKGKMQARELSKVPGDLTPVPVTHSSLPAPSPAPIELVSPAVASVAPQGASAGYPPRGAVPPSAAGQTGKKKGKKGASFAEVAAKAATAPGPPKPPLGPKADLAQLRGQAKNTPPPPRPSLVLSLTHHTLASTLRTTAALAPPVLVNVCNTALASDPIHANVRVSAAKWSPKGNLVMFAGPDVSRDALFATSSLLTSAISRALPGDPRISSRLNVKWGKVMINSVPTGVTEDHPSAHSPAACWQSLIDNNPSLRHLKVCQLPSWVRRPSLFQPGSQSSLVLAFEDLDGSLAPSLIRARNVYAFGAQCRVVRWRNPPPSPAKRAAAEFTKKARNARSSAESVAGSSRLPAPPPVSVTQLAALQERALSEGNTSAIPDLTAALTESSKRAPTSSPPSTRKKKTLKKNRH